MEDSLRGCVGVGHQRVETGVVSRRKLVLIRAFCVVLTQNIVNIFPPVLYRLFGDYSENYGLFQELNVIQFMNVKTCNTAGGE